MEEQLEILDTLRVTNENVSSPEVADSRFSAVLAYHKESMKRDTVSDEEVHEHG